MSVEADRLFAEESLAALYDAMCARELRDDFDFYLPMVMAAGAVLDVGCGTGAMLHEARAAGHAGRLCGLDPAPGMLVQARKRADIEWVESDLASADWDGAFDLVVMTGHAFQVLVEDDDLRAALAAAHRALVPGGVFAFETRNPAAKAWESWTIAHPVAIPGSGGAQMVRQVTTPFDGRTVSFSHTFTGPAWDQPQVSHSTLRFLEAEALNGFLSQAGFVVEAQFGDFDRSPLTPASPEIVVIARRP